MATVINTNNPLPPPEVMMRERERAAAAAAAASSSSSASAPPSPSSEERAPEDTMAVEQSNEQEEQHAGSHEMNVIEEESELKFEFEFAFPPSLQREVFTNPLLLRGWNDEDGDICKYYLKGTCMKGDSCSFRHARNDKAVVCKHWLRGLCKKGPQCEFLHKYILKKMPICFFFSNYGECHNTECKYRHIDTDEGMAACPWYARGFCKHGSRCSRSHVRKQACERYLQGFCPDGPKCKFGHPKYELPLDEDMSSIICHRCNQPGHKAMNCPMKQQQQQHHHHHQQMADMGSKPGARPLQDVTCFKCGQKGHYANACSNKRVPPPPGGYKIPPNHGQGPGQGQGQGHGGHQYGRY